MFSNVRLRSWLVLLILVAVLPAMALLLYSHTQDQALALERTRSDLRAVASLAAANHEQSIEGVRQILGTISAGPSVRRSDLAQLCREFIGNVAAVSPDYSSIGVLDLAGRQRCAGENVPAEFNASDRRYFRDALTREEFTVGEYLLGRASGRKALTFAVPVYDYANQLKGVAYVGLDLERADRRLKALQLGSATRVYVVNSEGVLLASSQTPPAAIGAPVPDAGLLAAVQAGRVGEFETTQPDGQGVLHVLVPVRTQGAIRLLVAVSAYQDEVLGPGLAQLRQQLTVLLASTLAGVVLAAWLAHRQVARPVTQLLQRMQRAGRGEDAGLAESAGVLSSTVEFAALHAGLTRMLEQLHLQQAAVISSSDGIMICDAQAPDLPLVYVNPAFERMTGYSADEVLGRNCRFLQGTEREQPGLVELRRALAAQRAGEATLRNFRRDGSVFWNHLRLSPVSDATGRVTHFVGIQTDVSARVAYEEELARRAHHDMLTGLPNRQLLEDRMAQAILKARRSGAQFSVAFLDLDNFKTFNDSIGHSAGDEVLREVARRLGLAVRPGDTVSRLGGDEFVVLLDGIGEPAELEEITGRLQRTLAEPVVLQGRDYFVAASIGLAIFPRDGDTVTALIQRADSAMYKAKSDGRGVVRSYQPALQAGSSDRLELARDLRKALAQREFELHYQPQMDNLTGQLCGYEALVRWRHPQHGMIPPLQFIELAEQTGAIVPLGEWVLEEACRQNQAWRTAGLCDVPVAVNVSGIQFKQDDLVQTIGRLLQRTGLPAERLHLEITESVMMNEPEVFVRTLQTIRAMGIRVALDDFGTGYSSLSYLKRFPVDYVKIDRSFVRDIIDDPMDAAICGAIIAMAHNMNIEVIAEGVENQAQADFLRERGCDQLQGYLIGRPLAAEQLWASA